MLIIGCGGESCREFLLGMVREKGVRVEFWVQV